MLKSSFLAFSANISNILGNLPLGAVCYICNEDCSMEPGLIDFQCCWCQRAVHTSCLKKVDEVSIEIKNLQPNGIKT